MDHKDYSNRKAQTNALEEKLEEGLKGELLSWQMEGRILGRISKVHPSEGFCQVLNIYTSPSWTSIKDKMEGEGAPLPGRSW